MTTQQRGQKRKRMTTEVTEEDDNTTEGTEEDDNRGDRRG